MTLINYLKEIPLPPKIAVVQKPATTSRIIILDRSGSMWHEIENVVDNVIQAVKTFPDGDTISVGWFSSEGGLFRFELIGCVLGKDRSAAIRILEGMRSVKALTCFSEIMTDAKQVVNTLTAFNLPISLIFHSDGYPVVNNIQREESNLFDAINIIRPHLAEVLVVGYGEYYNRRLLSRMADALGGKLMHSQTYRDWNTILNEYSLFSNPVPRLPVPVGVGALYFDEEGNVYEPAEGLIYVSMDAGKLYRYLLSNNDLPSDVDDAAVYTLARILLNQERVDEAVDVLTQLGDVAAAEKVSSAWTPQEFGLVSKHLDMLSKFPEIRFEKGCHPGQKPALDAPCLLDVVTALTNDDTAKLWIGRGFDYKRIGKPRKPAEGMAEFLQAPDLALALDGLVWNEKRLNLSALFTIPGMAILEENDLGLPKEYPCIRFKTFTIVNDGRLNITSASFSMSRQTFATLQSYGVIGGMVDKDGSLTPVNAWFKDVPYKVDFSAVPLVNGKTVLTAPKTDYICEILSRLLIHEAELRVLNAKSKALKEAGVVVKEDGLTSEQQAFLASKGIVNGVYRPKMEDVEASDSYIAPTLEIAIKGYSSLPHPDKVAEKDASGNKKLTPSEELIKTTGQMYEMNQPPFETAEKLLEWLEEAKHNIRKAMSDLRAEVQRAKFAVLLGHKWFTGVDRNDPTYEHLGYTFVFKMGEEKIEI